uniref:carcinoembryonic antigen-related cell adhesion molecule 5-like n=1 Tax=Semicossyphus pulcher TaxID=241346 RepID=UPI0037E9B068
MEIAVIRVILLGLISGLTNGAGVLPDGPLNAAVGGTVTFTTTLTPTENPFISLTWRFDERHIITSNTANITNPEYEGRITFFKSIGSLELRNLTLNDRGEYTVTILPHGAGELAGKRTLNIYEPIDSVRAEASSTDLMEFSSVRLSCSSSGSSLSFLWMNGSSEVTASDRVHLTDGGSTLTITNVLRYDQGPFRCYVSNPVSDGTSDTINLIISYGPENTNLKLSPSQEYFEKGSNISLSCSADSRPEAHFNWFLNGEELPDTGPELRLVNVQESGNYSCRASNIKTLRSETSVQSRVSVLERISGASVTSSTNLAMEGNSVNLTCDAAGSVFNRKWMKDGSDLTPADNMIFYDEHRVLSFQPLKKTDSGEYSCNVSNPVSNEEARYIMVVNYGPENVQITGPREIHPDQTFTLTCSAESEPPAHYTWILNGAEIHSSAVYTKENTEPSDSGNYTCQASNTVTVRSSSAVHGLTVTAGGGLSAGAIAAIIITCLIVTAASAAGGYYIYKKKVNNKPQLNNTVQLQQPNQEHVYENASPVYENVKFRGLKQITLFCFILDDALDEMEIAVKHVILLGLISGLTNGAGVLPDGPLNAAVGGTVTFTTTLTPTENPVFSVTWRFDERHVITSNTANITASEYEGRITLFIYTGSLELRNLALNDRGEYRVTITPHGAAELVGRTTLNVYEPIDSVRAEANSTDLVEFSSVCLSCSSSGSSPSFFWMNGSSEVTASDRVQLTDGGSTLTITNVLRYDLGPFRCNVSNPVSDGTSDTINLIISYGPENTNLKLSPSQEYFEKGSNISLSCSADSRPEAHFNWFLNGEELPDTGPELRLVNVQERQSGNYSCQASNFKTLRSETSVSSHVSVLGASITSSTNLLIEGNSVNLTCDAVGPSITRKWMKDGSDLTPADNMIFYNENRVLSFQPLKKTDGGEYSCHVSNSINTVEARYIMVVNYGPENVQITGNNEIHLGQSFTLNCSAESGPSASYTWILNGAEIQNVAVYIKENAETSDSGNYTCLAKNNITETSASAFHVLTVPGKLFFNSSSYITFTVCNRCLSAGAIAAIVITCLIVTGTASAVGGYYIYKK